MSKIIEIKCVGAGVLSLDELEPFQGDLKLLDKKNYERLKKEIILRGFSEPISVWTAPNGTHKILNGHQRVRVVREMVEKEGYFICRGESEEALTTLPVSFVEAADEKEAKLKVLGLTSQYGDLNGDGLYKFLEFADIKPNEIDNCRFPDLNLKKFKEEFYSEAGADEGAEGAQKKYSIQVACESQAHMVEVVKDLQAMGLKCKLKG